MAGATLLLASCGAPGDADPGAGVMLDCERHDYPCAAAHVAPEVAREGIRIGEAALDRFAEDGAEAALAWVRAQHGVAHAIGDDVALRFRLKGGRPVWVLTAAALGHGEPSAPERVGARSPPVPGSGRGTLERMAAASLIPDLGPAASVWAALREVAGRDRNEDRKVSDRDFRRALVLDPFHWEWSRLTSYDYREGIEITRLLEATPGYEGGVVRYLRDHQAGEEAFKGWNTYDVVHFSGHGHRICEYDGCFSMIFTGDTVSSEGTFDDATLGLGRETGIFEIRDPWSGDRVIRKRHVALGADWFAEHYRGVTLDRTLVVLNGCETMNSAGAAVPDFLRPLLGSGGSTTVGWTEVVPGEPAQKAALSLYRQMSEHGLTAGEVMQRLEREKLTTAVNTEGKTARLRAGNRSGSAPRHARIRIREVVNILAPDGGPLTDGVPPPEVVGGSADDGRRDTLHVDLLVDGVLPEQLGRWSMALELNGRTLRSGIRLSERQKVGEHAYRVPVTNVPAGKDFKRERPDTLEAVVSLPEGGESRSTVVVRHASGFWTLAVSGDIALPETRNDRAAIMGIDRRSPEGCQLAIGLAPSERYPAVSLSAILPAGLSVGRYAVGTTGPGLPVVWRNELASPGVFFAQLQVPPEYGTIDGRLRSRHFGSTSGTIQVEHFDGVFVRLRFAIQFRENGVRENPGPRTVSVEGVLAQGVGKAVTAGGYVVGDPSKAPSYIACERRSS